MMITAQTEGLTENIEELKRFFHGHWSELAEDRDKVQLNPQYDIYLRRDALGEVVFVSLREAGAIIGYFVGFISPALHYKDCLTCLGDIFYIEPGRRGLGGGMKLFAEVKAELKRRGVQRWRAGHKIKHDASPLFRRMGFEPVETIYSMWIGD